MDNPPNQTHLSVKNDAGYPTIQLEGNNEQISIWHNFGGTQFPLCNLGVMGTYSTLMLGHSDLPADLRLWGKFPIVFDSRTGSIHVHECNNIGGVINTNLLVINGGGGGNISIKRNIPGYPPSKEVLKFEASEAKLYVGDSRIPGNILLKNFYGKDTIHIEGKTGNINLLGADCAEVFEISEDKQIDSGTVLVIGEDGKLHQSEKSFDKRVAGVVSGGRGCNPGITLNSSDNQNRKLPIALVGKVYCKVDASYNPIETGDLLTTSPTSGHAMKANNPVEAFGAIIGKALSSLKQGTDLIPILVALQ